MGNGRLFIIRNYMIYRPTVHLTFFTDIKFGRLRWAGHVAGTDVSRNVYKILIRKSVDKRPSGNIRSRWVDFREIQTMNWMKLV